jgi:hypothetical protein
MKRFPPPLPLLPLSLGAVIWSGGSGIGVAVTRAPLALPPAQILSFTATPAVIRPGEEVILRWQVSGAEHIWLSNGSTPDASRCIEQESGELRVTPSVDGRMSLHVFGLGRHVSQETTIQVEAEGFCAISGEVTRNKAEYRTSVELYRLNSKTPAFTVPLDSAGQYSFLRVAVGDYRVAPAGKYPSSVRPAPRSASVQCFPNGSHRANFRIASTEG